MKLFPRWVRSHWLLAVAVQVGLVLPALAQEEAPSPADSTTGYVFRWINFALVAGALIWAIRKFGAPFFRDAAQSIQNAIRGAAAGREAAERELHEANRQLASLDAEIQEMRRAGGRESASEAERLRALAGSEADKIAKAALAEIEAAGRAAQLQLRALAALAATERAAALVRQRMSEQTERSLFGSFLGELERGAQ